MTAVTTILYECDRCKKTTANELEMHLVTVNVQILEKGYPGVHFIWRHLCNSCHDKSISQFREWSLYG